MSEAYRRRANERVGEALPAHGDLILDAASGAIQYPDYVRFSEGFRRRVCVDLSRRGLLEARRRIGSHGLFVEADVTRLPFAANGFDAVVSLHTLYHVPEDEQGAFLGEIARVLRAGRRAVVVSSWRASPWGLALRIPGACWRRIRRLARRARKPGARAAGASGADRAPTADLYFSPTRRVWLRAHVPPGTRLAIGCWRSVGVELLRQLPEGGAGRNIAKAIGWLEDRMPRLLGLLGVYPLLVFEKDRRGSPAGPTA